MSSNGEGGNHRLDAGGGDDDDYDGIDGSGRSSALSSARSLQSREIVPSALQDDDDDDDDRHRGVDVDFHRKTSSLTGGGDPRYSDDDLGSTSFDDDEHDDYDDDEDDDEDDDDMSLGFPPGHITRLDELNDLQNAATGLHREEKAGVNPSVIPSYFFCPLTRSIMRDPVITPYGNTYERRAILRHLVLEEVDPMSNGPLGHEDLAEDRLVRRAIDKARKESWVRYVVEFPDGGEGGGGSRGNCEVGGGGNDGDDVVDRIIVVRKDRVGRGGGGGTTDGNDGSATSSEEASGGPSSTGKVAFGEKNVNGGFFATLKPTQKSRRGRDGAARHVPDYIASLPPPPLASQASTPSSATIAIGGEMPSSSSRNNHGWSVPLGVHRISCAPPGLVVTADVHRRSNVVKRKIIRKSLADAASNKPNAKRSRMKKGGDDCKIVTSVITRDLVLPPGSYVEVTETRVHGGRVRGRIVWEEEVAVEIDRDLALHLEEVEVRERAMARPEKHQRRRTMENGSPGRTRMGGKNAMTKAMTVFRRKSSVESGLFASELFDQPQLHSPASAGAAPRVGGGGGRGREQGRERGPSVDSPSPLVTIQYSGWISLQWAGSVDNYERDEVIGRRRSTGSGDASALAAAVDEDEGPWSQPLPLGVYRIGFDGGDARSGIANADEDLDVASSSCAGQIPLHDAPDDESNAIDFLVPGQCIEIVETQVLVIKKKMKTAKDGGRHKTGTDRHSADAAGEQVVRARCMVPVIVSSNSVRSSDSKPQRKFRFGWITLFGGEARGMDNNSVAALPIPLGAYIFRAEEPQAKLSPGSCIEVVATRIEFEERDGMYHSVAVRGLIASGGYATLSVVSIGASGGSLRLSGVRHESYAEPVPLGAYRMTYQTGVTCDVGNGTAVVAQLEEKARVRVVETRVENGCVRGRVVDVRTEKSSHRRDARDALTTTTGWVSLFEPPSCKWAEHISDK